MTNLKILKAEIKNFAGITAKEVTFAGRSALIIGKNGANKSGFLKAVAGALNRTYIPKKPLKDGETHGSISITVGGQVNSEEREFTVDVFFSEDDQKGRVVLTDSENGKAPNASTKQMLDSLVGDIGFDIFKFIRLGESDSGRISEAGAKKQVEQIKDLMTTESVIELEKIDTDKSSKQTQLTTLRKEVTELGVELKNHGYSEQEIKTYSAVKDTAVIEKKFQTVLGEAQIWDKSKELFDTEAETLKQFHTDHQDTLKEIEALKKVLEAQTQSEKEFLELVIEKRKTHPETRPSSEVIQTELNEANNHNVQVESINKLKVKQVTMREKRDAITKGEGEVKEFDKKRGEVFTGASFPIKGLEFIDNKIMLNNIPLADQNTSTQMVLGMKIAMLKNPNLKTMFISDGSLLDKNTINALLGACEKNDYQVFIEMVDYSGEKDLEFEFIEKSVD